jgi:hypothetical protein
MEEYPKVVIKSVYGNYIIIILDEYFQENGIVESIIKTDHNLSVIVNFNKFIKNPKLDLFFNEIKMKDKIYLNYHNENIEMSLL